MQRRLFSTLAIILFSFVFAASGFAQTSSKGFASSAKDTTPPSDVDQLTVQSGNGSAQLDWQAATDDTGVTGYKVYYGTKEVKSDNVAKYEKSLKVGDVTHFKIPGLKNGTTYYFAVTALDAARNESENYSPYSSATPTSSLVADTAGGADMSKTAIAAPVSPFGGPKSADAAGALVAAGAKDVESPTVTKAEALYKNKVRVVFSEPVVLPATHPEEAFIVQDNVVLEVLKVTGAIMDSADTTGASVLLDTAEQNPGGEYLVTVGSEVADKSNNPINSGTSDYALFKGSALSKEDYDKAHPATPTPTLPAAEQSGLPAAPDVAAAPVDKLAVASVETKDNKVLTIHFNAPVLLNIDPTKNFVLLKKGSDEKDALTLSDITVSADKKDVKMTSVLEPDASYTLKFKDITSDKGVGFAEGGDQFEVVNASVKDVTPPEDVANFVAKLLKEMGVKFTWKGSKNSAGDLLEYVLYKSSDNGKTYGKVLSLSKTDTAYELPEVAAGTYWFKLAATDQTGNESAGKTVKVKVAETGPELGLVALLSLGLGRAFGRRKKK